MHPSVDRDELRALARAWHPDQEGADSVLHAAGQLGLALLLGMLWLVRWIVRAVLLAFEPLVHFVCVGLALLLTATAFLFHFAIDRPDFPFWGMLTAAVIAAVIPAAYWALIRLLSR